MKSDTSGHRYPPSEWTTENLKDCLVHSDEAYPLPTYDDECIWEGLRSSPVTRSIVERILEAAAEEREEPAPEASISQFLNYVRTGERTGYTDAVMRRRKRLSLFTLAECLEREGRYLDNILDSIWAACEQTTWVLPGHSGDEQSEDGLPLDPRDVPAEKCQIALFSARTGLLLAEVDYVLGDALNPTARDRIRTEVDLQVFEPYLARDDFSWFTPPTSNWNAVCNASTAIAAFHLVSDVDRLASIVVKAAHNLRHYLDGFDEDGCTAEGVSYWNFGFSHYVMFAAHLDARTDGQYSLLSPSIVEDIARFPIKVELSSGRYVAFADTEEGAWLEPFVPRWVGEQLELPELTTWGQEQLSDEQSVFSIDKVGTLSETIRNLYWCRQPSSDQTLTRSRRQFFAGNEWWIARADPANPQGLTIAAKGGRNDEPHNHNDCGSFIVHYRGESQLVDLGKGFYDREYFDEHRYEHLVTRSLGHSVPSVNGYEQVDGEEYAASVVDRSETPSRDEFEVELKECYPVEAGLESLRRRFALERSSPEYVSVRDRVEFAENSPDREFESVLVSGSPVVNVGDHLRVTGERGTVEISIGSPTADVTVEYLEDAVNVSGRTDIEGDRRDVWRARIHRSLEPGGDCSSEIETTITPES